MICTLKDIAKALGITVNTVSHALLDKDDISEALKEKVRAKAAEMGYVANRSAAFLRTGKTRTIAIVYDDYINPYYSLVTGYIQRVFEAHGYNVMIFTDTCDEAHLRYKTAQNIVSTGADGVLSFLDIEPEAFKLLSGAGRHVLMLGRRSADPSIDCVTGDDVIGGYLATRHLIEKGHRDILMFGASERVSCVRDRVEGYRRALEEAGVAYRPQNVLYMAHDNVYSGKTLVRIAEERGLKYTAVFCFNDLLAFETMAGLEAFGKRVPEDVSVVGFDHLESHLFLPIHLTTIDADKIRLAELAARHLLLKLEDPNARPVSERNAPVLVEGKTVRSI